MYVKDTWRFKYKNEIEIKFLGKFGRKGEKRAKRVKATPEQIKKQNQKNKEKNMHRLIQANFDEGDLWVTLKYPKGYRPGIEEIKKDKSDFLKALRKEYKKRKEQFKWIIRVEIGKRGGVHMHLLVNRCWSGHTDLLIQKCWKYNAHTETVHEDVEKLAEYIVKPLPEEAKNVDFALHESDFREKCQKNPNKGEKRGQKSTKNVDFALHESTFTENVKKSQKNDPKNAENVDFALAEKRSIFKTYSCSRNLERPKPERKIYTRYTVEKMIRDGIKPQKGYAVIKDSIYSGINPYTGYSYLHYQERRLRTCKT